MNPTVTENSTTVPISVQTMLSLTSHFNPEIQSKFTAIVGLANISGPSGYMSDDVISIILGYAGDIDVKNDEMDIMNNTIKKIEFTIVYTGTRLDGSVYTNIHKRSRLYCSSCDTIMRTDSYKVAFNHCLSLHHTKNISILGFGTDEIGYQRRAEIENRISFSFGKNCAIIKFRITDADYPDSWKLIIREKRKKRAEKVAEMKRRK